ncbi:MAG: hypothetical protein ABUT20_54605 [Bacteroidota bacterium]
MSIIHTINLISTAFLLCMHYQTVFSLKKKSVPENWYLNNIITTTKNNFYRVSCSIAQEEIWFESNVPLKASPEAFAGMLILPALLKDATIHITIPVDEIWYKNNNKIVKIYHEWWETPLRNPIVPHEFSEACAKHTSTGSSFSCGIDSFYTLLSGEHTIDYLVFCQGLDVSLHDTARVNKILTALEKISKTLHKKFIFIRTNIRHHSLLKSLDWASQGHGAILCALGHLLANHIGTFVISPSNYIEADKRYGSHWRLDYLFSSSSLNIIHTQQSEVGGRPLRTSTIAHSPIVQKHLRVCWRNKAPWNCSQCEKCIRTMIDLCACQALEKFEAVFDLSIPLAHRIQSLGTLNSDELYLLEKSLSQNLPLDIKNALENILMKFASINHSYLLESTN